ncbi:ROK family transcriptional regulator [Cryobacterium melibiosiphilum]|nr:ROK family transcriptional regulator [Cryobacterium melibiosiphilum]
MSSPVTPPLPVPLDGMAHSVAVDVLLNGPLSRKQLATRLRISPGSVTRVVKPLVESGLLVELAPVPTAGMGRPEEPLDTELRRDFYVGVKITETAIHAVVTTLRAQVVAETTHPLASLEPAEVAQDVATVIAELAQRGYAVRAAGVSLGGPVTAEGWVSGAPLLGWYSVDFGALLRPLLNIPLVVDNDLLALVRAEKWFGAAKSYDHFALLTIGSGVGYGLVVGGRILEGPDAGLSTIAHLPLDIGGGVCAQGHTGCAETILTTPALLGRARLALGDSITHEQLLARAPSNPAAAAIVETAAFALGKLIASIASVAMPHKIILTGDGIGLAIAGAAALQRGIEAHRDQRAAPIDLEVQVIGFTEWARGAAVSAIETFVVGR